MGFVITVMLVVLLLDEVMAHKDGLKTCSRGHTYRGSGPCPVCWPGRKKRK